VQEKENTIVRLLQDGDNEEAKYIIRWLQKALKTGAAEKTMISALARSFVYTPPNLILTKLEKINTKQKMGEDAFFEECARVEYAIKEAACESPNYGAIIKCMLQSGTDTEAL
jgi:DNA ligase 1